MVVIIIIETSMGSAAVENHVRSLMQAILHLASSHSLTLFLPFLYPLISTDFVKKTFYSTLRSVNDKAEERNLLFLFLQPLLPSSFFRISTKHISTKTRFYCGLNQTLINYGGIKSRSSSRADTTYHVRTKPD